ncbi:MAG: ribonuclease PH [Eubacteriales bacterium]|nr:ribonuclease PH [Eubacteriales bacterium]
MRNIAIKPNVMQNAAGSCLVSFGNTKVLCTASVETGVPPFLKGSGQGWLTAEYAMLPGSTLSRKRRDDAKRDSRGVEISRLIGRSLRQAVDLFKLGENTITIDCDVIQADGGTRTASVTGGFVALCLAVDKMMEEKLISQSPIVRQVAAVSCGIVEKNYRLDLDYSLDSNAETDMNVVADENGNIIELQATGEQNPFSKEALNTLVDMALRGIRHIQFVQQLVLMQYLKNFSIPCQIVLASQNKNKAKEVAAILGKGFSIKTLAEVGFTSDIEENGTTFSENAAIKSETALKYTGLPCIADDSGLSVKALNGAPGIYSARYSGIHGDDEKNNEKLLLEMQNIKDREAKFVCALALSIPEAKTQVFIGELYGSIAEKASGKYGFGYDPLLIVENGKTLAEISPEKKNAISHRAKALEKLKAYLYDMACGK